MMFNRFILVMAGVAAAFGIMAGAASAAIAPGGLWYLNESHTPLGSSEAVLCESDGPLTLSATVAGIELLFEAENVECIESTIFNEGTAKGIGKLNFTGVTVPSLPTCSVEEETVETEQLISDLYMESASATVYAKFTPVGARFGLIHIGGPECTWSGSKAIKGYVFGRAANATGVEATVQPLEFSAAIDATAGSALALAGNPAHLTGTVVNYLGTGNEFRAE